MLELPLIKQHVRLEQDFIEDDRLLETYCRAAQRLVENQTGRTLYTQEEAIPTDAEGVATDEHALVMNDDIATAMLLVIGHWYATRESVVIGTITATTPMAFESLISPYRHYHL